MEQENMHSQDRIYLQNIHSVKGGDMADNLLADALKNSLEMEEKGYNFYKQAGRKSKNEITKKAFLFLAEQETTHIENIKNFYNALEQGNMLPAIDTDELMKNKSGFPDIFSKNINELTEKIKPDDNEQNACKFAMDLEKTGYDYYKNMRSNAKNENLIKLLDFLLEEENGHYELIMKLNEYITDSSNWFMYEENSFPQG